VRAELQAVMWEGCGLERDATGLAAARRRLAALSRAADPETANLQDVAALVVAAAELRRESRGAHHRRDHPRTAPPGGEVRIVWRAGQPEEVPPASAA
jgi:L-aspartate oxidase